MFRGLNEAGCCARGRAHSGLASSNPPPLATSEFGLKAVLSLAGADGGHNRLHPKKIKQLAIMVKTWTLIQISFSCGRCAPRAFDGGRRQCGPAPTCRGWAAAGKTLPATIRVKGLASRDKGCALMQGHAWGIKNAAPKSAVTVEHFVGGFA
jgi:hypothetical protein